MIELNVSDHIDDLGDLGDLGVLVTDVLGVLVTDEVDEFAELDEVDEFAELDEVDEFAELDEVDEFAELDEVDEFAELGLDESCEPNELIVSSEMSVLGVPSSHDFELLRERDGSESSFGYIIFINWSSTIYNISHKSS
jgi:hypothetical protein